MGLWSLYSRAGEKKKYYWVYYSILSQSILFLHKYISSAHSQKLQLLKLFWDKLQLLIKMLSKAFLYTWYLWFGWMLTWYWDGLTSWIAVMTTCCTDSSKVMMIWMYSGKDAREISQTYTYWIYLFLPPIICVPLPNVTVSSLMSQHGCLMGSAFLRP